MSLIINGLFDYEIDSLMNDIWCVDKGEVYTWGWKECVPSGKVIRSWSSMKNSEVETSTKQSPTISEQGIFVL